MTTLLPALINPVDVFAASGKPQWLKEAMAAAPDRSFRTTLSEARQRSSSGLETAENRRLEAPDRPELADRPEPPKPRETAPRDADADETATDRCVDQQPDEAAATQDREPAGDAQQSGETPSEAPQNGDAASPPRQDSAQAVAQQPTVPAQGLLGLQLAGEVLAADTLPQQTGDSQNGQVQNVVMAPEAVADRTAAPSASPIPRAEADAESTKRAADTFDFNLNKDADARPTQETAVKMSDLYIAERGRAVPGTETERTTQAPAPRSQEQARPAERSPSQQTTGSQQSPDAARSILQESPTPDRQAPAHDRESGTNNQQTPRWTTSSQPAFTPPAAVARAEQVDAAVRLENATAQAPTAEIGGRTPTVTAPPAQTQIADNLPPAQVGRNDEGAAGRARSMSEAPFASRVIRGLTAMINQRGGVMNMRLEPPQLGDLRVQMTIARGQVSAQFQVTTAEAHAMLDKSMSSLRAALESHGLTVERLHVQTPPSAQSQDMREGDEQQQDQRARDDADAGGGQSRGRSEGEESQDQRGSAGPVNARFAEAFASVPTRHESEGEIDR